MSMSEAVIMQVIYNSYISDSLVTDLVMFLNKSSFLIIYA